MDKRPILGLILIGLAIAVMLALIDLLRSRKWFESKEKSNCDWLVTFTKSTIGPFEWPVLFNWLHKQGTFDVKNDDIIKVKINNTTKAALDEFATVRGWKYEAEHQC